MTNEELTVIIKQGNRNAMAELWEQCQRFCDKCAYTFYNRNRALCIGAGVEAEDLKQCGFCGLLRAVEGFDTTKEYKLLTYAKKCLWSEYNNACGRSKGDRLFAGAVRLNVPLDEEDGDELLDTVADQENAIEDYLEGEYIRRLRTDLEAAMDKQLTPEEQSIIRRRYFNGCSLGQVADSDGVTTARVTGIQRKALGKLAMYRSLRRDYSPFVATGLTAFRMGRASSVERNVEWLLGL